MNLGKTNIYLTLLSNVAVLVGIIFLAVEIRQNNELMASEARFNILSGTLANYSIMVENFEFSEIYAKGSPEIEESLIARYGDLGLTQTETLQLTAYASMVFRRLEYEFREFPIEQLPAEYWGRIVQNSFYQRWWGINKGEFDPEFVNFIDNIQ